MCGISGANATDLIAKVVASGHLTKEYQTDRFEAYLTADKMDAWVFTKPTEPAHPAITCRHMFRDSDGSLYQTRDMRCDSTREACDKLFLEFQNLDDQLKAAMGG